MAPSSSRVRRPVSRAAVAAVLGITFTLVMADRPVAGRDVLRQGRSSSTSTGSSDTTTSVNSVSAQTAATAKRAQETLLRAAQALKSVQSLQSAARTTAAASTSNVPNGLTSGGLVPDSGAAASGQTVWTGASLPTQTVINGKTLVTVTQNDQQAVLNWSSFNIGRKTTLYFNQSAGGTDSGEWIVFNKINDPSGVPSKILGSILAEGQVYVINQNGIIFGGESQVNVHALVASALPINTSLITSGILDNTENQFLFSTSYSETAGGAGGDVVVEAGATLTSPTTSDHVGGKVILVGENVTNEGTIYTPDGQTILAAGEQVGFTAHNTKDSSLRGLDVYIGTGGGTVENSENGLINAPRASVTMSGKTVNQLGVIRCTTSVSLNGRIDLLADYDSISQSTLSTSGLTFLPKSVGVVTLGAGSVTEILPETDSTETVASTSLTLTSLINIQGRTIHLGSNALILAPGASAPTSFKAYDAVGATLTAGVTLRAGEWNLKTSSVPYTDTFVTSGGQIYLDDGAAINVAGLTDVSVALSENIITAELRGTELADSVVQRTGVLRGLTVTIDARVGTSLADVSGYIDLIAREVGELSVNGGSVSLSAGESVVLQQGSTLDVSGGWISYTGGTVKTTRLLLGNNIIDIADASSDLVYSGVYSGFTKTSSKWGVSATYTSALLTGSHYESSYVSGGDGGSITITAPAMVLDGTLYGNTVTGERQRSDAPTSSSLTLNIEEQKLTATNTYTWVSPALAYALDQDAADPTTSHALSIEPLVVLASLSDLEAADAFALSASGDAVALRDDRRYEVFLSTDVLNKNGFGNLTIDNSDGDLLLPSTEEISGVSGGSLTFSAANITLNGKISMPGGNLKFTAYDYSPLLYAIEVGQGKSTPSADLTRGIFILGSSASLDVSGAIVDDRSGAADADTLALVTNGGSVTIKGYDVELGDGSVIDVSSGVAVSEKSKITYGDAGSITIEAGRDPSITAIVGGKLHLGATLLGYAGIQDKTVSYTSGGVSILGASLKVAIGRSGGSLSILAPLIQIGGSDTTDSDVLYLDSDFFNQGGFSTFTLSGLGEAVTDSSGASVTDPTTGEILYKSAMTIAADITPTVSNQIAVLGEAGSVTLQTITLSESLRDSVSLTLKALGVKDSTKTVPLVARGDLVLEDGVTIDAGLLGSVTLSGNTVDVLGSVIAPGGSITISGATSSNNLFATSAQALATVVIGSHSVLDVSGVLMLIDDVRGYRTGAVLEGGDITVSGNIVASAGAVLDVSGASGVLDLPGTYSGEASYLSEGVSRVAVVATLVESDAGTITLTGGQELYSDATLIGSAGGSSAQGGSLVISSGYFESTTLSSSTYAKALLPTLVVTQSGLEIATSYYANGEIGIGAAISDAEVVYDFNDNAINGLGHFTVDDFTSGGFDSLTLKGTVLFQGNVSIEARSSLTVADGGVIYGTSSTTLSAPHVTLGASVLADPQTQAEYLADYTTRSSTGQTYSPTYGTGVLTVIASLIDIGDLSLRDIGTANFIADDGDIRGCGTLDVAGDIYLRAGQIYPPTASSFTIAAYDHDGVEGSVTIAGSGTRDTPLSAGGELNIYASIINQGGVLRAPLGTINLGWSGADTVTGQSIDLITGSAYATTKTVTLLAGSLTSVSADGLTIPYGINVDGTWIDPTGTDITTSGPPAKTINVTGVNIDDQAGSVIDLSGGGDLYAYAFTSGTGGSTDVLLSSNSFAVIPGYSSSYAATSAYNSGTTTIFGSDVGYTNSSLKVGDCIYLSASSGLPAGYYTLLPARYALLEGAYLVTLKSGTPTAAVKLSDGSTLVSGYKTNSLNSAAASTSVGQVYVEFEVASSSVVRARSEYTDYSGNEFFAAEAVANSTTTPRLALDAGRLVLQATQSLSFAGSVLSEVASGGRGSLVDISSPSDIVIAGDGVTAEAGELIISTSSLNAIGADSLLIGGLRSTESDGVHIEVTAESLTVDNEGDALTGKDIILVANQSLTLEDGAEIEQTGSLVSGAVESVLVSGDGLLLRVSADTSVGVTRSGIPTTCVASLNLGSGVRITAKSLTLDSSYAISLDPSAALLADAVALHSGQISLEFNGQGAGDLKQTSGKTTGGLVLSGDALSTLMASVKTLSLLSYSSIDLYGTGQVGDASFASLSLHAAQIRGFNDSNVTFVAQTITLDNSADVSAPAAVDGQSSTLEGTLTFNGKLIELGNNQLDTGHYANVALNASGALVVTGSGGLSVAGSLAISTPLITGAKAANIAVSAGGSLTATTPGGTGDTSLSGLGAALVLQGASVNVDTKVWLSSGDLTLYATEDDVQVGGTLDVGGTYEDFYDVIKYSSAGEITLKSDYGNIALDAGSVVNVAAQSGAGNAGTLIVKVPNGTFAAAGTLKGSGGTDGDNGTFSLDVGSLAHTASLDAILNAGGFTASRTYRVRTGDVLIDGLAKADDYRLSSDEGDVTVTSTVDASGAEGGTIFLAAHGSLILKSGALLTVAADDFNSAGEGGLVTLEAGDSTLDSSGNYTHDASAVVDIQTGSTIDLSVASATSTSASLGDFTGILHLRAPQNASQTDVQINPINGKIVDASVIIVEGYRVYNALGGSISSVLSDILANGNTLVGVAGSASAGYYAMLDRLVQNNSGIKSLVSIRPGAEIVNTNSASGSLSIQLSSVSSTLTVAPDTTVTFPSGTSGDTITTSVNATITLADGTTVALKSGVATTLAAGSSITFANSVGKGTITFKSGSNAIAVSLPSNSNFTTAGTTVVSASGQSNTVQLAAANSKITVAAGVALAFPNGTPGDDKIKLSVAGTITLANGTTQAIAANTAFTLSAGSSVTLSASGSITYASGTTGGAISVTLPTTGSYTLGGTAYIATGVGDLTLGTTNSTSVSDLDLSSYRFGPKSAPGILTLRAAGSIYLYNSISDGFTSSAYTAELLAANSLLPANAQSWSYRIVSGADFSGVDFSDVEDLDDLSATTGSVLLGKYSTGIVSGGANALTSTAVKGYYQVIRTGSGDIDIYSGRSVKLLNQFATIYTAGTRVTTPTTIWTANDFDLPISTLLGTSIDDDLLGAIQQSTVYTAQYSMGGGDVVIKAQEDIKHETLTSAGSVAEDSERQLPTNWLYRRGYVDRSTGLFGTSAYGEIASTTWWVDYSNFFEGVGALGGGNVSMIAGHDIVNVDAVIPTNARMPKGTPDASKLLELGGGDLLVRAGHDISAGVYYVERGNGVLSAGNSIITNSTRYPSSTAVTALSTVDPETSYSWLPTTLFLGKGSFEVDAVADLLLGPVVNAFLMPAGYSNSYLYKTYFSTYDTSDSVSVTSLTGDVTLRESTTTTTTTSTSGGTTAVNILQAWLDKVLRYSKTSVSYYQPWLRLNETNVTPFATATSLMPGTLLVTAFSGDINVVGALNLSPSPTGTVDLLAEGSINGLNVNGVSIVQKVYIDNWGTGSINLSDADPGAVPSVESPYAYQELKGISPEASDTEVNFLSSVLDDLFAESGSTVGSRGSLETRQALHAAGILHEDDDIPVHIYAESGAISGLTLYSGKASQIIAGTDITDIALYIQNVRESDVSIVSAGRDIIAYDASSALRQIISAALATNKLNISDKYPLTGDIQISGPGTLEVLAGRNLDLGDASSNTTLASDLGLGITSIGNARNPYLPSDGADIIAAAGLVGSSIGLSESALDVRQFVAEFLNPSTSGSNAALYLSDIRSALQSYLSGTDLSQASDDQLWSAFNKLSSSQQSSLVLHLFYTILRDAGRNHSDSTSPDYQYKSAYAAITALFPGDHWSGDISLASREIKTLSGVSSTASNGDSVYTGGNISLLAPGGAVIVGYDTAATSTKATDQGIITEHGGQISIFSKESVSVGTTRIFTLRGGDIIIWSTLGDIAAGSSSKTVKAASPTRVVIDPQSANVKTDLSGLATGGGIGVLATVADVAVGSVDLVAPSGNIDAGDAGIRATGNLYVAALQILNAGNIQVGGASTGTPTAAAAPNIGNLTSASNAAGSALNSSASVANQATAQSTPAVGDEIPSIITVEVIGYGGGDED